MKRKKIQSMVSSSFVAPDFFDQPCLRSAATAALALERAIASGIQPFGFVWPRVLGATAGD
jgi:hypothetical protein